MKREDKQYALIGGLDRRDFLALGGIAAAAFLAACNSRGPKSAEKLLRYAERKNRGIERALFRHTSMDVVPANAFAAGARS